MRLILLGSAFVFFYTVAMMKIFTLAKDIEGMTIEEPHREFHSMIATAYCLNGTTATGTQTREGVAASKREWFGKTARVYKNDGGAPGDLICEVVIEDTGGRPIRNGSVIDIWMPTRDQCMNFGRRLVLVEIVD